jgi:hypothetical protein
MRHKDFFLIISPPDGVNYQVSRFKKACAKYIGVFDSLYSKAHISFGLFPEEIQSPPQKTFAMERFIRLISEDIYLIEPTELKISGFGYFEHRKSRTIYAAIETNARIAAWFNRIKEILRIEGDFTPHITIAKTIPVEHFERLWPFFQNLDFNYSFTPGCITVLTREVDGKPGNYKLYTEIPFGRRPNAA